MGLPGGADLAAEIEALNARLGLPGGLREMGVNEDWIPTPALAATKDHCNAAAADYEDLFRQAM